MNEKTKLKKAAEAVGYEIDMFNELSNSLSKPRSKPRSNPFEVNVLLESWVIHTYCLFRFFYQGEVETKNKRKYKRSRWCRT